MEQTQEAGFLWNPAGFSGAANLRYYWQVICERRWLVLTTMASVVVLSLITLFQATPMYRATAKVQIDPEAENILRIEGFAVARQEQDYLQTQYKNLLSRTLVESVLSKLNLGEDARYAKSLDPVESLVGDITISPVRLSRLVMIHVEHPEAAKSAAIANTLVSNFIQANVQQKIDASLKVVEQLKGIAQAQKGKLEQAELALQHYSETNQTVSFEESENIIAQALKQMKTDHARAQSEAASARTMAEEIEGLLQQGTALDVLPQVANNPDIQQLKRELAVAVAAFAEVSKRYGEKHIAYSQAESKVVSLRGSLRENAEAIVKAAQVRAAMTQREEENLKKMVDAQEQQLLSLNNLRIEYLARKRLVDGYARLYESALGKATETELTAHAKVNNVKVVDAAVVPSKPVKPRKLVLLILGICGGLVSGIGLAFFVNYLDDSVKSQEDVESYLHSTFLGYLPHIKSNSVMERMLQSHLHPQSSAAESFRTIRAAISLAHKPDQLRILAIASTIPGEGKSLVASNLAIVTAQTGLRTLLLDSDLRRPCVHKAFQISNQIGLSSFLIGQTEKLSDLVQRTEVQNLEVISSGPTSGRPAELLESKRMLECLQALGERYDRIFLDCPPVSAVSDPLIIAARATGLIFVTRFNKIRREHAFKSLQRFEQAGIQTLGVLLNGIDFEGKDSYYYNYYYHNRYYATHYDHHAGGQASEADQVVGPVKQP